MKHCKACGTTLVQNPNEYPSEFAERKTCGRACYRSPAYRMQRKQVPCSGKCGALLLRTSSYKTAACESCRTERRKRGQKGVHSKRIEQARRYRILMAYNPYKVADEDVSFHRLVEAIKLRNPRTHSLAYDLAIERRNSAHG